MSGSALSPWAMAFYSIKYAREVASSLGCPNEAKKYPAMVECLRGKSVSELLSAEPVGPSFLAAFGPTIDGVIIPSDLISLMYGDSSVYGSYDLMFGSTKIESIFDQFSMRDEKDGIDQNRRDKILRTLVRNMYSYHLQVRYDRPFIPFLLTSMTDNFHNLPHLIRVVIISLFISSSLDSSTSK